jgi:hypothetical protein
MQRTDDESNSAWAVSLELLRLVRDSCLTEVELIEALGVQRSVRYHVLRKAGLLVLDGGGRVTIAADRLASDGTAVVWGNQRYWLDHNQIDTF